MFLSFSYFRPDRKFKAFLRFIYMLFKYHYKPRRDLSTDQRRDLSTDQTLIANRGRTAMLQYMSMQVAKYGVNFWFSLSVQLSTFFIWGVIYGDVFNLHLQENRRARYDEIAQPMRIAEQILPYSY